MTLTDPRFTMPRPVGTSRFRSVQRRMARWLDGAAHTAARAYALDALAGIDPDSLRTRAESMARVLPIAVLAEALGFADPWTCALRQPSISSTLLALSGPVSAEAEAALDAQLLASGRTDPDEAANAVALLHQCLGATAAMLEGRDPPVASTVRVAPNGSTVEVPLADFPFGDGPHACPGRVHALALVDGVHRAYRGILGTPPP